MRTLRTLIVFGLVLAAAAFAYVYSGLFDVAANSPEGWLDRVAETVADRSVERRAEGIKAPPLDDPALLRTGIAHYQEMCVTCHGAPGIKASEIGVGLSPAPPDLVEEAKEQSAGQIYWIVKNGIKMTGMPAFGVTHDERELWAIVALVKRLPGMTPEQYRALAAAAGPEEEEEEEHHHEAGEDHHHEAGESH